MTENEEKQNDFQKVNPDDFLDYENRYFETGGSGGSGTAGKKGRKTLQAIKKQQRMQSRRQQQAQIQDSLREVLSGFPDFENPGLKKRFLERYLNWVNENLNQYSTPANADLVVQTSKSGGPGGQNVNKRETRVLLVHQPTHQRSESDQTRSQRRNRELAQKQLESLLREHLKNWKKYLKDKQLLTEEELHQLLQEK
jgi:ATP-dependent Lon protease